ncbi:hypothetical protein [Moorena sp. SIO3I6]|uniref:hypothetical protein n=1 Tax=Moorena sp. SIO3I6 TaxID=2607831 RepID=UPI0013FBCC1B|nr:hypothetical protein [Moorena sp. SIO3I6]NEP27779.1 hypothetical protein [Moorena sp. SIO3I6]
MLAVAIGRRPRYAPEAFRQSRRYANAKRGLRPQLPRLCDRISLLPTPYSLLPTLQG